MRIFIYVLLFNSIAATTFSAELKLKQDIGPSYEETIDFIVANIKNSKGRRQIPDSELSNVLTYKYIITKTDNCIFSFDANSEETFIRIDGSYFGKPIRGIQNCEIDLKKVTDIQSMPIESTVLAFPSAAVYIEANNYGIKYDGKLNERAGSAIRIFQDSLETTNRLAKAFKHLAKICGADIKPDKPSPF